jgi:MFS transporter, DHA2 family, methylenomycin A resistance protein
MVRPVDPAGPATRDRPAPHRGLVLAAATLGFGVIQLDVSVVNVAVKPIGAALGAGVTGLQWVVDAYTLSFAALILTAGALGDRRGARRVQLGGFIVFTVASTACGLAPAIGALIAARAVQGIGAAALGACSLALLNHTFPGADERARAVGLWTAGGAAALAAGPLVGGLLIAALGWRWIFFINVPLGAAGWWLTARYAAETAPAGDRGVDLPGQLTAVVGLTALAGATIEAGSAGFGSPVVIGGYLLAVLAGGAFVLIERTRERPLLPLRLFRSRTFSVAVCAGLLINVVFYGLIFTFSLFLQRHAGLSPFSAGLAFLPVTVLIMASDLIAGQAIAMLGTRWVSITGALAMGAGCLAMFAILSAHVSALVAALVAALSVTGFGIGLIVTAITSALLGSVDQSRSGIASGTLTAFRQTGSVLGVALFGSLLAGMGAVAGLRTTCAISAVLIAAVAVLSFATPNPASRPACLSSARSGPEGLPAVSARFSSGGCRGPVWLGAPRLQLGSGLPCLPG